MLTTVSSFGYTETVERLLKAIGQRGLAVFAQLDHAAGAREVGMVLPDEVVVVFGNPRAGTPLMQADPRVGIELPLRVLVWNQDEQTLLGYDDPRDLARDYELTTQMATLEGMSALLRALVDDAAASTERDQ